MVSSLTTVIPAVGLVGMGIAPPLREADFSSAAAQTVALNHSDELLEVDIKRRLQDKGRGCHLISWSFL